MILHSLGRTKRSLFLRKVIAKGSGGIVRLPINTENENATIIVKDGTKKLKKGKLREIPIA